MKLTRKEAKNLPEMKSTGMIEIWSGQTDRQLAQDLDVKHVDSHLPKPLPYRKE